MFYKGNIICSDELKQYRYSEKIGYCKRLKYDDIFLYYGTLGLDPVKAGADLKEIILRKNKENFQGFTINDSNIKNSLDINFASVNSRVFQRINSYTSLSDDRIIYELFKDDEGNLYGRELFTKKTFPILTEDNLQFDYDIQLDKKNNDFYLIATPKTDFANLLKCGSLITNHKVASLNDVDAYINKFGNSRIQKEIQFRNYKMKITGLANQNVSRRDLATNFVNSRKSDNKENLNLETSMMEDIEYSLARLKKIDIGNYQKYLMMYKELLTKNFSKEDLILLLNEIDSLLLFNGEVIDLISCLNQEKFNCLEYFINNKRLNKTLDLEKIDRLNDLFLKTKDKYTYLEQREIIKSLAFLYLMQAVQNKDLLSADMLANTYFVDYLKTIVLWINCLNDLQILNCDFYSLDDLSMDNVFKTIKSISFNVEDQEKVKKFVLTNGND